MLKKADADSGFEMGVESVIRDEVQGNRAMGQDDFARFGIDPGRIRLESGISGRREGDRHGQEGRDIPFAACGNPFRVEAGEGEASGIADGPEQVETAERQALEIVVYDQGFQGFVDPDGARPGGPDLR